MQGPFSPPPGEEGHPNPRFPPVAAAGNPLAATGAPPLDLTSLPPDTNVEIKPAQDYAIELVATFTSPSPPEGERLVAGLQTVDATVYVDFKRALPLWWLGSVYRAGEISPNSMVSAYAGDGDSFIMQITKSITLTHDQNGWTIPAFDTTQYSVMVGFGLGADPVFPAYLVNASPNSRLAVVAGGYQLARSSGGQTFGDIITDAQEAWTMALGGAYLLTFDSSGNGTLSTR